jgi:hypothetical protein
MKYYLTIFLLIFSFSINNAYAITPPAGCTADGYLTRDNGFGTITIDYYQGKNFACTENLSKNYLGSTIQRAPLTAITDYSELSEILDNFKNNFSSIISFFAGTLAIISFIMGVNGGKLS